MYSAEKYAGHPCSVRVANPSPSGFITSQAFISQSSLVTRQQMGRPPVHIIEKNDAAAARKRDRGRGKERETQEDQRGEGE